MAERTSGQVIGDSERWASVLAGAMLILASLRRNIVSGALLAGGGAALIFRGVAGHDGFGDAVRNLMSGSPPAGTRD